MNIFFKILIDLDNNLSETGAELWAMAWLVDKNSTVPTSIFPDSLIANHTTQSLGSPGKYFKWIQIRNSVYEVARARLSQLCL